MERSDATHVLAAWDAGLPHDRLDCEGFRKAILDDPDYDAASVLVAESSGRVVGFVAAITRDTEAHIGALIVTPDGRDADILSQLLHHTEARARTLGARRISNSGYDRNHLSPGADVRYVHLMDAYERAGYGSGGPSDDMTCDLVDWTPTDYQREQIRRAGEYGARVVDFTEFTPERLLAWSKRATEEAGWNWFWEWWEYGPTMVIAVRDDEIVGFSNYWLTAYLEYGPRNGYGGLGPIGVLPKHRRHGIGTWMLTECMLRAQAHGLRHLWANQTNTPLYLPNGWVIYRQFVRFSKSLLS